MPGMPCEITGSYLSTSGLMDHPNASVRDIINDNLFQYNYRITMEDNKIM